MEEFSQFKEIIKTLRGPNGCQWDKEQNFDSIKPYLLEETYEVIEAIMDKDYDELKEELGDLLCQVVFLSQLADEENRFNLEDVVKGISDKMVKRHPHVFGDLNIQDTDVILKNWEKIKSEEKKERKSKLDGIPKTLPALARAYKTQEKAARVGFDWPDIEGPIEKLEEEVNEFKEAYHNKMNKNELTDEMGDILFSIVNISRFLSIDPESALQGTISKFISRFQYIENELKKNKNNFEDTSIEEMEALWQEAKKNL